MQGISGSTKLTSVGLSSTLWAFGRTARLISISILKSGRAERTTEFFVR